MIPEPQKRHTALIVVLAVVGFAATGLAVAFGVVAGRTIVSRLAPQQNQGPRSIDQALVKASQEVNKTCPQAIDSETRLDNTHAGIGRQFYYRYSLINLTKDEVNREELASSLRPGIVNQYKTSPLLKSFREAGVTVHYQYSDKDGVYITDVVVGPADLK